MAPIVGNCTVCIKLPAKYKCPKCTVTYCSMDCFKVHKETICGLERPNPTSEESNIQPELKPKREFEEEESEESGWRLSRLQLETLAKSEDLRQKLRDPRIQQIISHIDLSINAEKELDKAMIDPEFFKFANQILLLVDPSREVEESEMLDINSFS